MRPTRWGWVTLLMTALALASAGASGNNLLYLLYGALAAAGTLAAAAHWLTVGLMTVSVEPAGPSARGADFTLHLRLINRCPWPCYGMTVSYGESSARADWIEARGAVEVGLRLQLPYRGLNRLEGLLLSSGFPFGLLSSRRRLDPAPLWAWPAQRPVRGLEELSAAVRVGGRPLPRKGGGDEFYGLRELSPEDDARAIHWKMSAKAGRLIAVDHGASRDPRLIVSLPSGAENDERLIEEAASACRFAIEDSAEVALEAGGRRVDFGRGRPHLEKILGVLAGLGEGGRPRGARAAPRPSSPARPDLPQSRALTLAAAAVVFAALGLIDEASARLAWVGLPVLCLGAWTQSRDVRLLPSSLWTALSLFFLVWTAGFDWRLSGVAVANVHLVEYLLCYRLIVPIKEQELGQTAAILFLGFFLASGLTISLWYFAAFLAFAAVAAAWLAAAAGAPWRLLRKAWAPSAVGAALSLMLTAVFFTLTPRSERFQRMNPLLAAGIDRLTVKSSAVTGFTDNVSLGWFGQLKRSSARVMRVQPVGWGATGRPGALHVRGSAFDLFDGHRWTRSNAAFFYREGAQNRRSLQGRAWASRRQGRLIFPVPAPGRAAAAPAWEFNVYPMNLTAVFTVETPWLIEGIDDNASFDVDDSVRIAAPYLGGLRYREYANPLQKGLASRASGYDALARRLFLQAPPDAGGRVAALARRAVSGASTPQDKVRAVEAFLQGRYSYSTYSDGRDRGLDDFLFRSRRGNCEYFATAAVILLRHAGVAARLATGFLADDWNEYGRFFDVRQNEAHAWVEAYIPGKGWILSDPTPAAGLFSSSADAFGKRLARWLEAAQTQWYRRVIGYDRYLQNDTFRRLSDLWSAQAVEASLSRLLRPALAGLGLIVLAAPIRRVSGRWRASARGPFARAQAALARAGIPRPAGLTPREFASEVGRRRPDLAALAALAELHYVSCFSPAGLSAEQENAAERLLREVRARL